MGDEVGKENSNLLGHHQHTEASLINAHPASPINPSQLETRGARRGRFSTVQGQMTRRSWKPQPSSFLSHSLAGAVAHCHIAHSYCQCFDCIALPLGGFNPSFPFHAEELVVNPPWSHLKSFVSFTNFYLVWCQYSGANLELFKITLNRLT